MKSVLGEMVSACTGCEACSNVCPKKAICMREDIRGFFYPQIQENICINCNKCKEVCPVLSYFPPQSTKKNIVCYAAMALDEIRYGSSSGGAFFVLASHILANGGVVAGAAFQADLSVRHVLICRKEDLVKIQKSKYVQSVIGAIFSDIKKLLEEGKSVLFSGCPCQAAGLRTFLGKEYEKLYIIDIFCHGVPSQKMLTESLANHPNVPRIVSLDFRDKALGWDCSHLKLSYDDSSSRLLSLDESHYEQGFHYNLTLRSSCYNCKFCELPHPGDISLGDFWGIDQYKPKLNDQKGTSLLIPNTEKGKFLLENVAKDFPVFEQVPSEYLSNNRIHAEYQSHPNRNYFLSLYPGHPFNKAVEFALQNRYDIGLVGNWSYPNYGSELTYFALFSLLESWGKSVLMISWPKSAAWPPYGSPQLFRKNPYPPYSIAPLVNNRRDLKRFNKNCDTFLLGSDQLFNNNLYNWFDKFMQLDWVSNNKTKIAYAASFGADYIWGSNDDRAELAYFMQKFDYVAMREQSGVELAKKYYNVDAALVLDPVFLIEKEQFFKLMAGADVKTSSNGYLFAYTLNPTKEKAEALLFSAAHMGLDIRAAGDAALEKRETKDIWGIETTYGLSVEEWLVNIAGSDFVITDSFHGTCFSIIFEKPFIAISNSERGASRFSSLLGLLGLEERLIQNETELLEKRELFTEPINYADVKERLLKLKTHSLNWLKTAISSASYKSKPLSTYDLSDREFDLIYGRIYDVESSAKEQIKQLEAAQLIHEKKLEDMSQGNRKQYDTLKKNVQKSIEAISSCNQNQLNQLEVFFSSQLKSFESDLVKQTSLTEAYYSDLSSLSASTQEMERQREQNEQQLHERINSLQQQIDEISNSKSYFIGRIITWLPYKISYWLKKTISKIRR